MAETIDHSTGEIIERPTLPAVVPPARSPTPYQSDETANVRGALARAQGEMEPPKRNKPGHFGSYAPLEEILRVAKGPLSTHGLSYHQGLVTRGGEYFIRTYIGHESGEWLASDYPMLVDKPGPQGFAGGVTYARRYGLTLALGLAAEDDDDGTRAQTLAEQATRTNEAAARRINAVSKANPAVQGDDAIAIREAAKAPFRRLRGAVEAGEVIHDGQSWLPGYAADAALVDAASPSALEELRLAGMPKSTGKPVEAPKARKSTRRQPDAESPPTVSPEALAEAGYEAAQRGIASLESWWGGLSDSEREYLQPGYDRHLYPLAHGGKKAPGGEVPAAPSRSGAVAGGPDGSHPPDLLAPPPGDPPW